MDSSVYQQQQLVDPSAYHVQAYDQSAGSYYAYSYPQYASDVQQQYFYYNYNVQPQQQEVQQEPKPLGVSDPSQQAQMYYYHHYYQHAGAMNVDPHNGVGAGAGAGVGAAGGVPGQQTLSRVAFRVVGQNDENELELNYKVDLLAAQAQGWTSLDIIKLKAGQAWTLSYCQHERELGQAVAHLVSVSCIPLPKVVFVICRSAQSQELVSIEDFARGRPVNMDGNSNKGQSQPLSFSTDSGGGSAVNVDQNSNKGHSQPLSFSTISGGGSSVNVDGNSNKEHSGSGTENANPAPVSLAVAQAERVAACTAFAISSAAVDAGSIFEHRPDVPSEDQKAHPESGAVAGQVQSGKGVIQDSRNYGILKCVDGIEDAVLAKQMESLQTILLSMNKTLEEFHGVVSSLEKTVRDSRQLAGTGSSQPTAKQLRQRIGIKPTLEDCLDGLRLLEEMHKSEYLLKLSVVSALPALALKPSLRVSASADLGALQQLLADQPNIPQEEGSSYHIIHSIMNCINIKKPEVVKV
ncbi:hypothetical protein F511_18741 [Dorcoceras hygrometricum]|uniref:Uncharacterized protein n=1 Tax=Dorcoceras hygrometricum TaxID=472368 RepID=A0A2Z7BER6_9LAMI|nr:hypothetical protein F511_18741 [Dorcoceras hygrometricum]